MQITTSFPATAGSLRVGHPGRNRFVIGAAALGAIAAAAAWQWNWLIAIGIAPLLLSIAPCAAMCGLGVCMNRMGNRRCGPAGRAPQSGEVLRETLDHPSATQET